MTNMDTIEQFYKDLKEVLKKYNVRIYCGDNGLIAKFCIDGKTYRVSINGINDE